MQEEDFDPTLVFLACQGDTVVGTERCSFWLGKGWIAPLAVLRPWRRCGIGKALLLHAFNELYKRDIHTSTLLVDTQNLSGATRLYKSVGMRVAHLVHEYEKELRAAQNH